MSGIYLLFSINKSLHKLHSYGGLATLLNLKEIENQSLILIVVSKFYYKYLIKMYNDINNLSFRLEINGSKVQEGNTSQMIFSFEKIIAYVSRFITLKTGDLIYTGTPAGVGPVAINDRLEAYLEGEKLMDFHVK